MKHLAYTTNRALIGTYKWAVNPTSSIEKLLTLQSDVSQLVAYSNSDVIWYMIERNRHMPDRVIDMAAARGFKSEMMALIDYMPISHIVIHNALRRAAYGGNLNVVTYLIETYDIPDEEIEECTEKALRRGHLDIVKYLCSQLDEIDVESLILDARDVDAFEYILSFDPSANVIDDVMIRATPGSPELMDHLNAKYGVKYITPETSIESIDSIEDMIWIAIEVQAGRHHPDADNLESVEALMCGRTINPLHISTGTIHAIQAGKVDVATYVIEQTGYVPDDVDWNRDYAFPVMDRLMRTPKLLDQLIDIAWSTNSTRAMDRILTSAKSSARMHQTW